MYNEQFQIAEGRGEVGSLETGAGDKWKNVMAMCVCVCVRTGTCGGRRWGEGRWGEGR